MPNVPATSRRAAVRPEADAVGRRQNAERVGAGGVEGDVAEIEQTREADHDVEAPAEHHIGEKRRAEVERVTARQRREGERQREEEGEQPDDASDIAPCFRPAREQGERPRGRALQAACPFRRIGVHQQADEDDRGDADGDGEGMEGEGVGPLVGVEAHADEGDREDECRDAGEDRVARRSRKRASGLLQHSHAAVRPSGGAAGRAGRRVGR